MNPWLLAAFVLMFGLIPCGIVSFTRDAMNRLVGLQGATALIVIIMMLLAEG